MLRNTIDEAKKELNILMDKTALKQNRANGPKKLILDEPQTSTYKNEFYSDKDDGILFSQEVNDAINLSQVSSCSSIDTHQKESSLNTVYSNDSSHLTPAVSILNIKSPSQTTAINESKAFDSKYDTVTIKNEPMSDEELFANEK